jgi:site-specific DNA recombinase
LIKAVAYCRFSPGRNQREESIEAQLRAIHEYAKSHDMLIVKEYIDRAETGTDDDREDFKRMIRDSERRLFEVILTHKVDRFARNRYDSAIYKRRLRENGIKVIYVAQPISEGPEGALMESVLEGMAEYYSKNLAQEVMKGLKENAYNCKFCGGIPPLGYNIEPTTKQYVINQSESVIVKDIYDMYLQGKGYMKIVEELNSKGYRTKTGNKFGKNSIYEILRNEKYTGTYIFNRAPKKVNGKYNRRIKNDEKNIIKILGGIPEIIPRETWENVQAIMDSKKRPGNKPKEIYLLSGLLHSGGCGSAMTSDTRRIKDRSKTYFYYRCYKNNGKNKCSLQAWQRDDLENLVIEKFEKELFSGDNLDVIVERIAEYYQEHEISLNGDLEKIKTDLVGINKKIGNIVEAISNGGASFQSLKEKLASLELQKNKYQAQIDELENAKKYTIPSKNRIKDYLRRCGNIRKLDREEIKAFLNERIREIHVFPDRIDIDICVKLIGCGRAYTTTFTIAV